MSKKLFTDEIWVGGDHGLALAYPNGSEEQLFEAVKAVWSYPGLSGCYLNRDKEPDEQPKLELTRALFSRNRCLYGLARLRNNVSVACATMVSDETEDNEDNVIAYYGLYFVIPRGAFEHAGLGYGNYPDQDWEKPADDWFAEVGLYVYQRSPFSFGVVGFEADVEIYDPEEVLAQGVPAERQPGYLWPNDSGIQYFPRTVSFGPVQSLW